MPNWRKPDCLLTGTRLLLVEDNFLILLELKTVLREAGADTLEARTVEDALMMAEQEGISAAVLDIRIGLDSVAPVARRLAASGTPFLFYTGQVGNDRLMAEWPECKIIPKPAPPRAIVTAVANLLKP
jgi:DNA-binding response OmpR family regulator